MAEIKDFNGLFRLDGKIAVVTGGKLPFSPRRCVVDAVR